MGEYVNSRQVQFNKSYVSCGLLEAHHLPDQNARTTLYAIANQLYHKANGRPASFVMFSDVIKKDSRGLALAEFISQQLSNVGHLHTSSHEINPRTGNKICVWIITPDHEAFRKWYTEETMHRINED